MTRQKRGVAISIDLDSDILGRFSIDMSLKYINPPSELTYTNHALNIRHRSAGDNGRKSWT